MTAYLGLGIYHYYSATLPTIIKPLGFLLGLDGNKELGIQELEIAINNGIYVNVEAQFFLWDIYMQYEKDYKKALAIGQEIVKKYPNNVFFTHTLCRNYMDIDNYKQPIQLYEKVIQKGNYISLFQQAEIQFYLGYSYYKDNDFKQALSYYCKSEKIWVKQQSKDLPMLYYYIALCYEKSNSIKEAIVYYKKTIEISNESYFKSKAKNKIKKINFNVGE